MSEITYIREVDRIAENLYVATMFSETGRIYQLQLANNIPLGTQIIGNPRSVTPVNVDVLIPTDSKIELIDDKYWYISQPKLC